MAEQDSLADTTALVMVPSIITVLDYLDAPYRRFIGTEFEQETLFVQDPNGNILEMKTMVNPEVLFATP